VERLIISLPVGTGFSSGRASRLTCRPAAAPPVASEARRSRRCKTARLVAFDLERGTSDEVEVGVAYRIGPRSTGCLFKDFERQYALRNWTWGAYGIGPLVVDNSEQLRARALIG
jgi:hypothetical protein